MTRQSPGGFRALVRLFLVPGGLSSGRRYMEECESVRGWAITLVFLFHWQGGIRGYEPVEGQPSLLLSFLYAGNTGVTLFFVLSGFLLTLPFLQRQDYSLRRFYVNRLLRIYPLYTLVVLLAALLHRNWEAGLKSLLFYDIGLTTLFPFGAVWWSLVTEMQFYLLMPLLVLLLWNRRRVVPGVLLLGCATLVYTALHQQWLLADDPVRRSQLLESLIGRWPNFLCGAILAWVHTRYFSTPASTPRLLQKGSADLLFFGTLFLLALTLREVARLGTAASLQQWHVHTAIEGALFAVLIFLLLNSRMFLKRVFVNPAMNYIGVLSYSIYLLHAPILFFAFGYAGRYDPAWLAFAGGKLWLLSAGTVAGVLLASMLTYGLIERPFLQLKGRLAGDRRT